MHCETLREAAQMMREDDCETGEEPFYDAIADWLERFADAYDPRLPVAPASTWIRREVTAAYAIARAYLGVNSDA